MGRQCSECGQKSLVERLVPSYEVKTLGVPVILLDAVTEIVCSHCNHRKVRLPRAEGLSKAVAMIRVLIPIKMTGDEIRFLRKTIRMTQAEFADQIIPGLNVSTLSRWEHDAQGMGGYSEMVMRQNVAALLAESVRCHDYNPKFAIGMRIIVAPMPPISLRRVHHTELGQDVEAWEKAAA